MSNNDFGVFCGNGLNGGNYSFEFLGYKGQCTPNGFQYTYDINSANSQATPSFQPAPSLQPPQKHSKAWCPTGCHLCAIKPPGDKCLLPYCCDDEFKSSKPSSPCSSKIGALHQAAPSYQPTPSYQAAPSFQQPANPIGCPRGCHYCTKKRPDDPCLRADCCTDDFKSSKPSSVYTSEAVTLHQAAPIPEPRPSIRVRGGGMPCPIGCCLCSVKPPWDRCPRDFCCECINVQNPQPAPSFVQRAQPDENSIQQYVQSPTGFQAPQNLLGESRPQAVKSSPCAPAPRLGVVQTYKSGPPAQSYRQAPSVQPAQKKSPCAPRLGAVAKQGSPCPEGCYLCAKKDPEDPCPIDMCCSLPLYRNAGGVQTYKSGPPPQSYRQAPSVQPLLAAPRLGGGPTQGSPCPEGCYLCAKKDPEDPCPIDMCCSLPM